MSLSHVYPPKLSVEGFDNRIAYHHDAERDRRSPTLYLLEPPFAPGVFVLLFERLPSPQVGAHPINYLWLLPLLSRFGKFRRVDEYID